MAAADGEDEAGEESDDEVSEDAEDVRRSCRADADVDRIGGAKGTAMVGGLVELERALNAERAAVVTLVHADTVSADSCGGSGA